MILPIVQAPDERLLALCTPVSAFGDSLAALARDLHDTRFAAHGLGLAAPQVGETIRLIALNPGQTVGFKIMVNPEIVKHGNNCPEAEEGCLSIDQGRRRVRVKRWDTITVRFQDLKGEPHEVLARGLGARVIQHEIDHLDGKLIA